MCCTSGGVSPGLERRIHVSGYVHTVHTTVAMYLPIKMSRQSSLLALANFQSEAEFTYRTLNSMSGKTEFWNAISLGLRQCKELSRIISISKYRLGSHKSGDKAGSG